jgi:hypothetical protein
MSNNKSEHDFQSGNPDHNRYPSQSSRAQPSFKVLLTNIDIPLLL